MDTHVQPELLGEYFDGLASIEQSRFIEGHLDECAQCADLARTLFANSALLDQWTAKNVKTVKDLNSTVATARRVPLGERVRQAVG